MAGLTDDSSINDGTGNESEETDEQIRQANGKRLVFLIDTPTNIQFHQILIK